MHEDKYQSFLEAATIIFDGYSQACPEFPKRQVCNLICFISRKKGEIIQKLSLHADKQTFLQVNVINIIKVLKIKGFQNVCSILKKA